MSGGSSRRASFVLKRSCLVDYLGRASSTSKQQSRSYLFRKVKDSLVSPPCLYSSTSSSALFSNPRIKNGLIGWYLGMLNSRPILTKSLTSAAIYTASDLSSQRLAPTSSDSYDLLRTLRMAGYGMLIAGPTMHFWFNFVSKVLPKRDVVSTLKKIVAGQAVYGPIMTAVFFSSNAGLQGENCAEIVARLDRDLVPTLKNGLMYWPVCDFITFKFVPVQLQPLLGSLHSMSTSRNHCNWGKDGSTLLGISFLEEPCSTILAVGRAARVQSLGDLERSFELIYLGAVGLCHSENIRTVYLESW